MVLDGDVVRTQISASRRPGRRALGIGVAIALVLVTSAVLGQGGVGPVPAAGTRASTFGGVSGIGVAPVRVGATNVSTPSFHLNVSAAPVGASVVATGSGFLPNSTANITVDSAMVNGSCVVSAAGTLTSPAGGPCTVRIPAVPGGNRTARAVTGGTRVGDRVNIGGQPEQVVVDPTADRLFVLDPVDSRVDVVNATNFTKVGQLNLTTTPQGLAVDPGLDRLYVTLPAADNISVFNASSGALVGNLTLSSAPAAIAVAANDSLLFATCPSADEVVAIALGNDSVVATAPVGSGAEQIAYDPGSNQIWVSNQYSDNLTVLDAGNLSEVRSVPLGFGPAPILADPALNETLVGESDGGTIAIRSAGNGTDLGNLTIPNAITIVGLALDPTFGELFATYGYFGGYGYYYETGVAVVSLSSDSLLATVSPGSGAVGVAFDPIPGEAVVALEYSRALARIDPALAATTPLRIDPSLVGLRAVESGQNATFSAFGFGAAAAIVSFTLNGSAVACTGATVGTCSSGTLTTASNGSLLGSFVVPPVARPGTYPLRLTDTDGDSATLTETVTPPPTVSGPVASRSSVDLGQTVNLSVTVTYGSPPYSIAWSGLPVGCSVSGPNASCVPTRAGTYTISATVVDANGVSGAGSNLTLSVESDPTIGNITASSPWLSLGGTVSFSVPIAGGAAPYSVAWEGLPAGCPTEGDPLNCTPTAPGASTVYATVTDANGLRRTSPGFYYTVVQYPIVVVSNASAPSIDLGQSVTFRAAAEDGAGGYVYRWQGLPSGCPVAGSTVVCLPTAAGNYSVVVQVTDDHGFTVSGLPISLRVFPAPTVAVTLGRTSLDVGETVDLVAAISGGAGGYQVLWQGLPPGCAGTTEILPCVPTGPGVFDVRATVTDSVGGSATSVGAATLSVWPALNATVTVTPTSPVAGTATEFGIELTGGARPISVTWEFPPARFETGPVANFTFPAAGRQFVSVWVNDSTGASVLRIAAVEVQPAPAAPTPSPWLTLGPIVGLVAAGAVIVVAVLLRQRPRRAAPARAEPSAPRTDDAPALYGTRPDEANPSPTDRTG